LIAFGAAGVSQVVIFVKNVQRAGALNTLLNDCNFPSVCIHRGMQQPKRLEVYKQFKENQVRCELNRQMPASRMENH
jgi:ATP-dependent RNA helicase UAP56/SUB2